MKLQTKSHITENQMMYWIGSDFTIQTLKHLLLELINGEYTAEDFKNDVVNHWSE